MMHDELADSDSSDSSQSYTGSPPPSSRRSISRASDSMSYMSDSDRTLAPMIHVTEDPRRLSVGPNRDRGFGRVSWGGSLTGPTGGENGERSERFRKHRREWSRVTSHLSRQNSATRKRRFSTVYGAPNVPQDQLADPFKDPPSTGANADGPGSHRAPENPNMAEMLADYVAAESCMVGEEPGIDMETTTVDLPDAVGSQVMVIDFSPESLKISRLDIAINTKDTGLEQLLLERPSWAKVRWIVVNGLSWEAIGPIANFYDLHALALEDMLEIPQRTKVETFSEQVFCCFPLHILAHSETSLSRIQSLLRQAVRGAYYGTKRLYSGKTDDSKKTVPDVKVTDQGNATSRPRRRWFARHWKRKPSADAENSAGMNSHSLYISSRQSSCTLNEKESKLHDFISSSSTSTLTQATGQMEDSLDYGECTASVIPEVSTNIRALPLRSIYQWNRGNDSLEAMGRLNRNVAVDGFGESKYVSIEQVSLFLMEGTVVTFFEKSAPAIIRPIIKRLESRSTLLRVTSDPAVLVQAVIDASVDMIEPISVEYRSRLASLQLSALKRPTLTLTRKLSTLLRDLDLLRSTVSSLVKLTNTLGSKSMESRRGTFRPEKLSRQSSDVSDDDTRAGSLGCRQTRVLNQAISDVAAMYFGDAADHALQYAGDLRTMRNHAKTLLMSIQNEMSIRGGDAIMMLSLVAVIFLPLSFLTGYFGMNFTNFKMLNNDVSYYWTIAGPSAGGLLLLLLWPWMMDGFRAVQIWVKAQLS